MPWLVSPHSALNCPKACVCVLCQLLCIHASHHAPGLSQQVLTAAVPQPFNDLVGRALTCMFYFSIRLHLKKGLKSKEYQDSETKATKHGVLIGTGFCALDRSHGMKLALVVGNSLARWTVIWKKQNRKIT